MVAVRNAERIAKRNTQRTVHAPPADAAPHATSDAAPVQLRPYQQRIVSKAVSMFLGAGLGRDGVPEPAARSVLIESPTGSGKTVMGLSAAARLVAERRARTGEELVVGWVAMRRNLLAQAEAENRRWGFGLDLKLMSMFDKAPPKVDLLVVDEAQHDAARSMADLHSTARPDWILGLSATPYRTDRVKLCFDKVIRDAGIHQLIQDGYLSAYHHYTIPRYEPQAVAECFARDPERWGRTLIFFHKHEECLRCQQALERAGHAAEIVTATSDRERQLDDFVSGRSQVLLNMAILTEGFDCPALRTVFCRPSTKGCTIQMGGRVFRKHPDHPFKQVVQCQETRNPFVKIATAAEQYVWEGEGWKALKPNRQLDQLTDRSLKMLSQTNVELPKFVVQRRTPGALFRRWDDPDREGAMQL